MLTPPPPGTPTSRTSGSSNINKASGVTSPRSYDGTPNTACNSVARRCLAAGDQGSDVALERGGDTEREPGEAERIEHAGRVPTCR